MEPKTMEINIASRMGWSCPQCGKAHAPDVKTCPEPKVADCWPPVTFPKIVTDCGCPPGASCGSTSCPRAMVGPNTWITRTPECGTVSINIPHDPNIRLT